MFRMTFIISEFEGSRDRSEWVDFLKKPKDLPSALNPYIVVCDLYTLYDNGLRPQEAEWSEVKRSGLSLSSVNLSLIHI